MTAKLNSYSDRRAAILQQYREHKLTSTQARAEIKALETEIRRGKKTGGKKK